MYSSLRPGTESVNSAIRQSSRILFSFDPERRQTVGFDIAFAIAFVIASVDA
jgi:hypothetical protein